MRMSRRVRVTHALVLTGAGLTYLVAARAGIAEPDTRQAVLLASGLLAVWLTSLPFLRCPNCDTPVVRQPLDWLRLNGQCRACHLLFGATHTGSGELDGLLRHRFGVAAVEEWRVWPRPDQLFHSHLPDQAASHRAAVATRTTQVRTLQEELPAVGLPPVDRQRLAALLAQELTLLERDHEPYGTMALPGSEGTASN